MEEKKNEEKKTFLSKVPGFRSGKLWKKILASIGYAFITLIVIGIISGDDAQQVQTQDPIPQEQHQTSSVNENHDVSEINYTYKVSENAYGWSEAFTVFGGVNPALMQAVDSQ